MNIYVYELIIWIVLVVFTIFWFRTLSYKTKHTDDHRSKNSWFTLMLLLGIPLILFIVIAPVVVLMGDAIMPVGYKIAFGGEILTVLIYLIFIQRTKEK